jgi:arylsulfatase A-like enzyme
MASRAVDRVLAYLDALGEERSFVFFHTYDCHDPYTPSPPFLGTFGAGYDGPIVGDLAELRRLQASNDFAASRDAFWRRVDTHSRVEMAHVTALYDETIVEVDQAVGRLIRGVLERRPRTVVIVVSDHGEQFGEHGGIRHDDLYEELLRVPLIIDVPGREDARRMAARVSLVDLAPTILATLGAAPMAQAQGRSLWLGGSGEPILSEKADAQWHALIVDDRKLIRRSGRPEEVYDLAQDPGERRPLRDRAVERRLEEAMAARSDANRRHRVDGAAGIPEASPAELSPETEGDLRALGYAQ